jgi:hypothetical protein
VHSGDALSGDVDIVEKTGALRLAIAIGRLNENRQTIQSIGDSKKELRDF